MGSRATKYRIVGAQQRMSIIKHTILQHSALIPNLKHEKEKKRKLKVYLIFCKYILKTHALLNIAFKFYKKMYRVASLVAYIRTTSNLGTRESSRSTKISVCPTPPVYTCSFVERLLYFPVLKGPQTSQIKLFHI